MVEQLELWGGLECSVARIGSQFRDQFIETGHDARIQDLEIISGLGIKTLRYPINWERIAPNSPDEYLWSWTDSRLDEIRRLGLLPIAGLLHHGSGPRYTDLADPQFPNKFAQFSVHVAERFPWITDWTPINEPLTTARFSGLYGVWYPHGRSEELFWRMVLNQIDATIGAMKCIRRINSQARLIQTEDLGITESTASVKPEADFHNLRRWATWDLLAGTVTRQHPLWERIAGCGLGDRLLAIADDPCPADILGINHYLTSNRFLDGRRPAREHSFNDIEAVRVHTPICGMEDLLGQAWERYRSPLAITEAHNGCTREEQLRWTHQAWTSANSLKDRGIDIRAVTAWALLGCVDWASLLGRRDGIYEVGAYDIRGGTPRPTAMARMLSALATNQPLPKSIAEIVRQPGWWQRADRFAYEPFGPTPAPSPQPVAGEPLLILGRGRLGSAIERACKVRGLRCECVSREELDLTAQLPLRQLVREVRPWAVINAAGFTRVDLAEENPRPCFAINTQAAVFLAALCADFGVPCVTCSSDFVFSGDSGKAYTETDEVAPINIYGESKAIAEQQIQELPGIQLIVRSAGFFTARGPDNLGARIALGLATGRNFGVSDDATFSPTYVPDLANAILDLLIDGETGVWHLTHGTAVSWAGLAKRIARAMEFQEDVVRPVAGAYLAKRPAYSPLVSARGMILPSLDDAIGRFVQEHRSQERTLSRIDDHCASVELRTPISNASSTSRRGSGSTSEPPWAINSANL